MTEASSGATLVQPTPATTHAATTSTTSTLRCWTRWPMPPPPPPRPSPATPARSIGLANQTQAPREQDRVGVNGRPGQIHEIPPNRVESPSRSTRSPSEVPPGQHRRLGPHGPPHGHRRPGHRRRSPAAPARRRQRCQRHLARPRRHGPEHPADHPPRRAGHHDRPPLPKTAVNFIWNPEHLQLTAGQQVTLKVANAGYMQHTFTFEAAHVAENLPVDKTTTIELPAPAKPGLYRFYCNC